MSRFAPLGRSVVSGIASSVDRAVHTVSERSRVSCTFGAQRETATEYIRGEYVLPCSLFLESRGRIAIWCGNMSS